MRAPRWNGRRTAVRARRRDSRAPRTRTHLSTTADENLLGVGVRGERGVHEALVVHVLVLLRALHQSVGDEEPAEGLGLHHLDRLELALPGVQHFLHLAAAHETQAGQEGDIGSVSRGARTACAKGRRVAAASSSPTHHASPSSGRRRQTWVRGHSGHRRPKPASSSFLFLVFFFSRTDAAAPPPSVGWTRWKSKKRSCPRGCTRVWTHPVGDGEAILEGLVVPVALGEDVRTDPHLARLDAKCAATCSRALQWKDLTRLEAGLKTSFLFGKSRCTAAVSRSDDQ